jgi:hypothetical protein
MICNFGKMGLVMGMKVRLGNKDFNEIHPGRLFDGPRIVSDHLVTSLTCSQECLVFLISNGE